MALSGTTQAPGAIEEEAKANLTQNSEKVKSSAPLSVSISRRGLLSDEDSSTDSNERRLSHTRLNPIRLGCSINLSSPSSKFRQIAEVRDQISRSIPSSSSDGQKPSFSYKLIKNYDYGSLLQIAKDWIMNPLNMALLLWISCVAVSGAILFLVMTGMLNHAIPEKSNRDEWFEINNQILNALFTLMCLYQHPKRFHHLVLLLRWAPKDIVKLREIYCENGTYKPNEWKHMLVVILLLHLNCFAQYAMCGLNLGYRRPERPVFGVAVCLVVAIGAAAVAGLYSIVSPLGREYNSEDVDCEAQGKGGSAYIIDPPLAQATSEYYERRRILEGRKPDWRGGLFDLWEDARAAYLSIFCTFCVFGWNMERLGFGNMYVHIATFLLLCTAPYWIFSLASVNIDNDKAREALVASGVILCFFGLLYGGFWRIQMRNKLNIAQSDVNVLCLRKPSVADCVHWLFCCWCSLAQEVRTADQYLVLGNESHPRAMAPLPREGSTAADSSAPLWSVRQFENANEAYGMKPPRPLTVTREDNGGGEV